ncbi:hypothetical protein [Robbsia andropogonis]|nr:hypothetical protein [Robbsia andropogonis]
MASFTGTPVVNQGDEDVEYSTGLARMQRALLACLANGAIP